MHVLDTSESHPDWLLWCRWSLCLSNLFSMVMESLSVGRPNPNCPLSLLNNEFWVGSILSILQLLWQNSSFLNYLIYRTKLTYFVIIHDDFQLLNVLKRPDSPFRCSKAHQPSTKYFGVSISYARQACHDDHFPFPMNADSQLMK